MTLRLGKSPRGVGAVSGNAATRKLQDAQALASEEQLLTLKAAMTDLEDMLRGIEEVSPILEFSTTSKGMPPGASERGHFRAGGNAAVVLAQEVAEDLKGWHAKSEASCVEYSTTHQARLHKAVRDQTAEQDSREEVRMAVRQKLYELARETLERTISSVERADRKQFTGKGIVMGNASEAAQNLDARLKAAVDPILDLRGQPPMQMITAGRAARWAVDKKRLRSGGRRSRLPDLDSHLDKELLSEVDEHMAQRKAELAQQRDLQTKAMNRLELAQANRRVIGEEIDEVIKAGCLCAEGDPWPIISPSSLAQDHPAAASMARMGTVPRKDSQGNPVLPQLSSDFEEAISATLTPQLLNQGEVRIKELCGEFYETYLHKDSGERARMVANELEKWQLNVKLVLLKDLLSMSQETHSQIMHQLKQTLDLEDEGPDDHMHKTLDAAADFHRQRQSFFEDQVDGGESALAEFCKVHLRHLTALRRRTELASLKRWNDVGAGLTASSDNAWIRCQCRLANEVRKALVQCHKDVALNVEKLDLDRGNKVVSHLEVTWKRCSVGVQSQLNFLESITKSLPSSIESCAVAKASMLHMEAELQRIIERLQAAQNAEEVS